MEDIVNHQIMKILDQFQIPCEERKRWGERCRTVFEERWILHDRPRRLPSQSSGAQDGNKLSGAGSEAVSQGHIGAIAFEDQRRMPVKY